MDYNRVQSYIKSHVLPKLDSLPDDVASVKQAFDAWKADWTTARAVKLDNLDATISSRASSQAVDGVRGGVDTTLTKLATLEGSVARLQDGLASVETGLAGIEGNVSDLRNAKIGLDREYLIAENKAVSVKGSGHIFYLKPSAKASITIDRKKYTFGNSNASVWFCIKVTNAFSSVEFHIGEYDFTILNPNSHGLVFLPGSMFLKQAVQDYSFQSLRNCYGLEPIRFTKGFSTSATGVEVVYTLDPT